MFYNYLNQLNILNQKHVESVFEKASSKDGKIFYDDFGHAVDSLGLVVSSNEYRGVFDSLDKDASKVTTTKIELWAQDIQGIIYYLDKCNNVYSAEDIVSNKLNPKVFAKYTKKGENYEIVHNSYEC